MPTISTEYGMDCYLSNMSWLQSSLEHIELKLFDLQINLELKDVACKLQPQTDFNLQYPWQNKSMTTVSITFFPHTSALTKH